MWWVGVASLQAQTAYDPLAVEKIKSEHKDMTVKDEKRSREVPIRVHFPKEKTAAPVVLFSHGLGGSRENGEYYANHLTARGYIVVMLQHPGSDESVWKGAGLGQRMAAMEKAASGENLLLRIGDVSVVLDQLEVWNKEKDHPLNGRLDLKRVGMSGHSFGAVTTQAVSGQVAPIGKSTTEPRIKAALAMSPSAPRVGDPKKAFGEVKIPWMLLTGTKDDSPIGKIDVKSRLLVYPALPPGGKYELVLDKAEHSAFSERGSPLSKEKQNPNHHKAILAVSTAFWDAYLREDIAARKWLDSDEVKKVLEKDDTWQRK
ncbi:MAG: dienelactone hydrolase [Planctomycetaceae bacterium]|nr:dienelactone hydrolase [Planctomycetaceae bacterium]